MLKDGVVLDVDGGLADDYAHLVTTDAKVAEKYGMVDESEYWGMEDENEGEEPRDESRRTQLPRDRGEDRERAGASRKGCRTHAILSERPDPGRHDVAAG